MPPLFYSFYGVVCSNTLFSNTSAFTNSLLFWANSTCKGSRTPPLVEHCWVPILGATCSNKSFVGTLRPSRNCLAITLTAGVPSQQEKIHAHSFVLEPELRIQYTYTYAKHSGCHRFWIRYTYLALFAIIYLVTDMNTHTWTILLVNAFKFNTNTYTSKIAGNSKCIYSRAHGNLERRKMLLWGERQFGRPFRQR